MTWDGEVEGEVGIVGVRFLLRMASLRIVPTGEELDALRLRASKAEAVHFRRPTEGVRTLPPHTLPCPLERGVASVCWGWGAGAADSSCYY